MLILSFIGSQLYEGFHGHLVEMEFVSLIAPMDSLILDMFVVLPGVVRLSPVPGLLDQPALHEGDAVLSSVSNSRAVVLRTAVDEEEEAEEDEELHSCPARCKVIRQRALWSFILNPGCRHQTVPTVTRNQECVGIFGQRSHKTRPSSFLFVNFAHKLAKFTYTIRCKNIFFCLIKLILLFI